MAGLTNFVVGQQATTLLSHSGTQRSRADTLPPMHYKEILASCTGYLRASAVLEPYLSLSESLACIISRNYSDESPIFPLISTVLWCLRLT